MSSDQQLTPRQQEALDIIRALDEEGGECTVSGLSEAMEISPPAAYQLLLALQDKQAIVTTGQKLGRAIVYKPAREREDA